MKDHSMEKWLSACAFGYVLSLKNAALPVRESERINPSERFRGQMAKRIAAGDQQLRRLQSRKHFLKMAASFAVVLCISAGTVLSVRASREFVFQLFGRSFSVVSEQNLNSADNINPEDIPNISGLYLPSRMPKGYQFSTITIQNQCVQVIYKKEEQSIHLIQQEAAPPAQKAPYPAGAEKTEYHGILYYYNENGNSGGAEQNLFWENASRRFELHVYGDTFSRNTLLAIAENLKKKG